MKLQDDWDKSLNSYIKDPQITHKAFLKSLCSVFGYESIVVSKLNFIHKYLSTGHIDILDFGTLVITALKHFSSTDKKQYLYAYTNTKEVYAFEKIQDTQTIKTPPKKIMIVINQSNDGIYIDAVN